MALLTICTTCIAQNCNAQINRPLNSNFSDTPATAWQDALVSGNGKMGILVYGDPQHEKIIFNHEMLYEFIGTEDIEPADIADVIPQVKELIKQQKYREAETLALKRAFEKGHPDILWTDPYHPACVMNIEQTFAGDVAEYRRSTGYTDGEIVVQWSANDTDYQRKSVVSRPANVIATHITASTAASVNVTIDLDQQAVATKIRGAKEKQNNITRNLKTLFPEKFSELNYPLVEPFEKKAEQNWLTFCVQYQIYDRGYDVIVHVRNDGGTLSDQGNVISISAADNVEILAEVIPTDPASNTQIATSKKRIADLASYDELLTAHTAVHNEMFKRVRLHLDKTGFEDGSNETLIQTQKSQERINPYLLEKIFNMGVYGLISSSGDNPPNLMGIWNGAWRPEWSGDFTLDANLNLQISAAAQANLPEAIDSYMTMLERIAPDWEINAKNLFGCRGYLAGTRTSGRRGLHTHFGKWPGNHWTAAAAWLLSPCYEHYQCSGDKAFMVDRLLPMMEKAALFYEDFLNTYDSNGKFLIAPSYSPENHPSNTDSAVVANATMDISAIRELLTNLITVSNELDRNQDKIETWQTILAKLPPYVTNEDGALQEWSHPNIQDQYNHRHVSHLYLAWPSLELTPENAKLFEAARVAIAKRGRGNGSAHGLAHTALIGTRLKQPELVYGNLLFLMQGNYFYRSLFTSHNPGVIYNSDALHSIPSVIMEMLVYSRPGVIEFLPACSDKLPKGSIQGVMCRTQARVDSLRWDFPRRELTAVVTSKKAQTIQIQLRRNVTAATVSGNSVLPESDTITVDFKAGETKPIKLQWKD
ncbi:Alpha-L-fucosidase [Rhodopirellula maiorica SM1]|uniref:Alpha-L-fucosidase n=2 Tax=Novipirellula TaxID=2795426 RepID=M5RUB9_9BACT|nr:Alpha-L-fucosidase [Rhodopirellula maiorica SM1]